MKKKSQKKHSRFIKLIARIINIRNWFDWDRVKSCTLYLANGFSRLFVPQKVQNTKTESFTQVVKELHLNDDALSEKQKSLLRLSILMVICAVLLLSYAGYQFFFGSIKAFIVSLVVTLIALVLAFRYHFWYFQIKHHKLGCTFNEWYRQGLLGEKK